MADTFDDFRKQSVVTFENKHREVVGQTSNMEHPWKKALRISGEPAKPSSMRPPEMAVPQFEIDRSPRDPDWGSKVKD